jgi:hypothetical protein
MASVFQAIKIPSGITTYEELPAKKVGKNLYKLEGPSILKGNYFTNDVVRCIEKKNEYFKDGYSEIVERIEHNNHKTIIMILRDDISEERKIELSSELLQIKAVFVSSNLKNAYIFDIPPDCDLEKVFEIITKFDVLDNNRIKLCEHQDSKPRNLH